MRAAHKTASHDLLSFSISRSLSPSSRFSLFLAPPPPPFLSLSLSLSLSLYLHVAFSFAPCCLVPLFLSSFAREAIENVLPRRGDSSTRGGRARVALGTRGPHGKRTGNPYKSLYNARQRRWLTRAVRLLSILSNQREARRSLVEEIRVNGRTRAVYILVNRSRNRGIKTRPGKKSIIALLARRDTKGKTGPSE